MILGYIDRKAKPINSLRIMCSLMMGKAHLDMPMESFLGGTKNMDCLGVLEDRVGKHCCRGCYWLIEYLWFFYSLFLACFSHSHSCPLLSGSVLCLLFKAAVDIGLRNPSVSIFVTFSLCFSAFGAEMGIVFPQALLMCPKVDRNLLESQVCV